MTSPSTEMSPRETVRGNASTGLLSRASCWDNVLRLLAYRRQEMTPSQRPSMNTLTGAQEPRLAYYPVPKAVGSPNKVAPNLVVPESKERMDDGRSSSDADEAHCKQR